MLLSNPALQPSQPDGARVKAALALCALLMLSACQTPSGPITTPNGTLLKQFDDRWPAIRAAHVKNGWVPYTSSIIQDIQTHESSAAHYFMDPATIVRYGDIVRASRLSVYASPLNYFGVVTASVVTVQDVDCKERTIEGHSRESFADQAATQRIGYASFHSAPLTGAPQSVARSTIWALCNGPFVVEGTRSDTPLPVIPKRPRFVGPPQGSG